MTKLTKENLTTPLELFFLAIPVRIYFAMLFSLKSETNQLSQIYTHDKLFLPV
jgi:hypothetical protein